MSQFNPVAIQAMNAIEQRRRKQKQQAAMPDADPMAVEAANLGASPRPRAAVRRTDPLGRPMSQMGPPTPAESTGPMPRAAAPAAAPAAQPAQRRATNPMMGPPDQYASRVQAGAQEFRTRRAEQDSALTARGIDPAAAREDQFINRAPDTRAMVLRAATLRARGQGAAADRMIEEVRQINQSNRVEGLERQALRNPERAGSAPAIDRIARRQQQQNTMRATEDALFTDANAAARVGSNTALTEAMRGRVDAETGYRSAIETQEGRIGLESQRIDTDMSSLQVQEATNQAKMRIQDLATEMTMEDLSNSIETMKLAAPIEQQRQLTQLQAGLSDDMTALEKSRSRAMAQAIVNQIEVESAGPIARAQAGSVRAGFDAQTAAAELSTLEAGEQARRLAELGPIERQAVEAQLQAQIAAAQRATLGDIRGAEVDANRGSTENRQAQTASDIENIKIDRMRTYVDMGIDPTDPDEVGMANMLVGGMLERDIQAALPGPRTPVLGVSRSKIETMRNVSRAVNNLKTSGLNPESKAKMAQTILEKWPWAEMDAKVVAGPIVAWRTAREYNKVVRQMRDELEDLAQKAN